MVIKNPTTDEVFEIWFHGDVMRINPGQVLRVDDARGNFCISEYGQRGLIQLEYGDAGEIEERKTLEGRKKNMEFRKKQVVNFNQENERRLARKLAMVEPEPHIIKYAKDCGLKVFEPFAQEADDGRASAEAFEKEQALRDEIKKKDEALQALSAQVAALTQLVHANLGKPAEPTSYEPMTPEEEASILRKLQSLNKQNFSKWLDDNRNQIPLMTDTIQQEVRARHLRLMGTELVV